MKTGFIHIIRVFLCSLLLATGLSANSQGRVVINEYLPWPANGCGATSEFVELLNFGPGPVDISCYIVTNGRYSITIPAGTILSPGQFYVISGQDVLSQGCGNINATIPVDLNWNAVNCTNMPIPTTGNGFMPDGGTANVNMVLLNPALQVVDAVTRSLPAPASLTLTSSDLGGNCAAMTFDLDDMNINYEVLGMSTGVANSFARKLDGDCGWEKDPQQSAGGTNNTSGTSTDIYYDFNIVNSSDCQGLKGRISIYVRHGDVGSLFPMNYTVGFDSDNDGDFDFNDQYTYGEDNTAPEVVIENLPMGNYIVTIASSKGCYLRNFPFTILPCYPVLPVKLVYFRRSAGSANKLEWLLNDVENLSSVVLEKQAGDRRFLPLKTYDAGSNWSGSRFFSEEQLHAPSMYRLKINMRNGNHYYSPIIQLSPDGLVLNSAGPNPVQDKLQLRLHAANAGRAQYTVISGDGATLQNGSIDLQQGINQKTLAVSSLPSGIYQLRISPANGTQQPICFRFVKH